MKPSVRLVLGVHSHQPVGNLDEVFRKALDVSYDPFLAALERHPGVKLAVHYSGCLLEWLESRAPAHLDRLAALARLGQVEMLGGAFYEPILPLIPPGDRAGQIRMQTRYLKERFGADVRGMWLAERIWEPTLPGTLADAGIEFTILDDYHFLASMDEDPVGGYYVTEDQGKVTRLFPISERLRYLIPFHEPAETLDYLEELGRAEQARGREALAVIVDDGEKFGMWPGTREWVYGAEGREGWLERFFRALEENASWLTTCRFEDVLRQVEPRGRVYLPPGSYIEMGGWALPPGRGREFAALTAEARKRGGWERQRPFLRGGFFRNFLSKYGESLRLLRRAQALSAAMDAAAPIEAKAAREGRPTEARRELWRGMCNCGYWHGIFGGLYLPHIRRAIGEHLARARRLHDEAAGGAAARVRTLDLDADGRDDVHVATPQLDLVLEPATGGALTVLDLREWDFPLGLTLTRRREVYHDEMLETRAGADAEEGSAGDGHRSIHDLEASATEEMKALVVADDRPRASGVLRFLDPSATPERLRRGEPLERGTFFAGRFEMLRAEAADGAATVEMAREGVAGTSVTAVIRGLRAQGSRLELRHRLSAPAPPGGVLMAVEMNLALIESTGRLRLLDGEEAGRVVSLSDTAGTRPAGRLVLEEDHTGFEIAVDLLPAGVVWHYPVRTVSRSEQGYEAIYQGSALLFVWGAGGDLPAETTIVLEARPRAARTG